LKGGEWWLLAGMVNVVVRRWIGSLARFHCAFVVLSLPWCVRVECGSMSGIHQFVTYKLALEKGVTIMAAIRLNFEMGLENLKPPTNLTNMIKKDGTKRTFLTWGQNGTYERCHQFHHSLWN